MKYCVIKYRDERFCKTNWYYTIARLYDNDPEFIHANGIPKEEDRYLDFRDLCLAIGNFDNLPVYISQEVYYSDISGYPISFFNLTQIPIDYET